ncbi:MAG: polymer-forming cytoskeletal protein [Candidatus Sulfotelmatobacter sp.]
MGLRGKDARERAFRAFSTRFSGPSRPTCTAKSGPKGNRLTIGPNGSVKANVNACAVVVQGKLEGNIHASDRVDLKQSAIVVGDIATQRISIDEGAHLKGGVSIQKEAPKKEVLGGIAVSRSEAAQRRIFLRLPEGEVSTVLLSLLKEMDGMVLMLGVLLWLASGNPVRNWQSWTHSLSDSAFWRVTPLLSLWMTDIGSMYPEYLLLGAICRAAGNSRFALLAEAAGGALGTCWDFLKSEI